MSPTKRKKPSVLEETFASRWKIAGGHIVLDREHKFDPVRKWRFDFAHVPTRVAIELEGGIWSGGRHTRGSGFEKDCEKYFAAAVQGWVVFRLTGGMITVEAVEGIRRTIEQRVPN